MSRFIHIGTEAALFAGRPLVDIDETHPYPERQRFLYGETKAEAERLVLAAHSPTLTTLSLRPRLIWGPRDTTILPTIKGMVEEGRWMWLDGGRARTSTCHVHNLVHAIELALTRGQGGHAYFVADDRDSTLREFLTALVETTGVHMPGRSAPGVVGRALAAILEGTWRLLRRRSTPPLTRFAAAMMSRTITVRTDKARRELGYRPRVTVDDGLRMLRTRPSVAPVAA